MQKSRSGFTIVELLIVIVVIAILAAISIVAYTGVQERAYNSKVLSAAKQYHSAFLNYKTINGSYPAISGCLGKDYPNNACWASNAAGGTPARSVNSSLDSALSEFMSTKPNAGTDLIQIDSLGNNQSYRGGVIYIYNDGTYGFRITYYLKGNNADCSLSVTGKANEGPLTQCNISLP